MEIKICGLTSPKEAEYLNQVNADYAGFVFYEKSKRNIDVKTARSIFEVLDPMIYRVAVVVSPDEEGIKMLQKEEFDIIQIHKELSVEVLKVIKKPVWYAFNVADEEELKQKKEFLEKLPMELAQKIQGIVVDSSQFGSGKTFDWQQSKDLENAKNKELKGIFQDRKFILAGGLTDSNVAEGIRLFNPDVCDVSSGVEGENGKDYILIKRFVDAVRKAN